MTRLIIFTLVALLAACAPKPPVEPLVRTVRVEVPIAVPCVADVPENDVDVGPLIQAAAEIDGRVAVAIRYIRYLEDQIQMERAARKACNTITPE